MERMLVVMAENPAAAVAGFLAMVCFATWPLFRARWTMLMAYIGNDLGFAVHYALLSEWTAVAMNGLMCAQTVVALMLFRRPKLLGVYSALMPVPALASVVTWQGLPTFLSAAATTISTIGRMPRQRAVHAVFDLMLCGHTLGGQLCLPFGVPVLTCAASPRGFARGAWRCQALTGYTSTGSGTSLVDVRLNCPPEVTLHRLLRQNT